MSWSDVAWQCEKHQKGILPHGGKMGGFQVQMSSLRPAGGNSAEGKVNFYTGLGDDDIDAGFDYIEKHAPHIHHSNARLLTYQIPRLTLFTNLWICPCGLNWLSVLTSSVLETLFSIKNGLLRTLVKNQFKVVKYQATLSNFMILNRL